MDGRDIVVYENPFGAGEFVDNPEPRCPCLLLLDTSGSMHGRPIDELNAGIAAFRSELQADLLATKRVEVALMTFGPVRLVSDFQTVDRFQPPALRAGGDTPMGQAIVQGIDRLQQRKKVFRDNGIAYYRPWVFLVTDGEPTDAWQAAAAAVRTGETSRGFVFFAVGVEKANLGTLRQIAVRDPLKLRELRFRDLFSWLSNSLRATSHSRVGEQILLPPPTGPQGWAVVD